MDGWCESVAKWAAGVTLGKISHIPSVKQQPNILTKRILAHILDSFQ